MFAGSPKDYAIWERELQSTEEEERETPVRAWIYTHSARGRDKELDPIPVTTPLEALSPKSVNAKGDALTRRFEEDRKKKENE